MEDAHRRHSFELLLSEYHAKVFRLAYGILGNRALAEDAVQEAFLRVWKGIGAFRGDSPVSIWIYTIARNTSLTLRKRNAWGETAFHPEAVERLVQHQGSRGAIDWEQTLAALPEEYR